MDLTIGLITDFHFGPAASFEGKLRKLSHRGPALLADFVRTMNESVRPHLIVNLGDDIEDESPELDAQRYAEAMRIFDGAEAPLAHVAGNHDTIGLSNAQLLGFWKQPPASTLYRTFHVGGVQLFLLHTHEIKDQAVFIDEDQLDWLRQELASAAGPALVFMHHSAADQILLGNRWFEKAPHICLVRERKRLREILQQSGRVKAVFNGHLHWNHLDVHDGIPYVTLQSPIENLDDDQPGRPAGSYAVARLTFRRLLVEVFGQEQPLRYQFEI